MNPFFALLWKELREGAKWSALGLIGFSAALAHGLHDTQFRLINIEQLGASLLSSDFLTMTAFGGALVALMLGLAQTLPESRGDRWGFLAHRPVSRSKIFAAKTIAGLLLYAIAVGVPFACAVIWAATPGHIAFPFQPRLALGGLADLSCGGVYYFGAMLVGMRQARWLGSRAIPAAAAVVCSVLVQLTPHFIEAELVVALGVLIVGAAAWGTFLGGGDVSKRSAPFSLAVGFSVAVGWTVVLLLLFAFVAALFIRGSTNEYRVYGLLADGSIVIERYTAGTRVEIDDLQGKPLPQFRDSASRSGETLEAGLITAVMPYGSSTLNADPTTYRSVVPGIQAIYSSYGYGSPAWYYIADDHLLAEYDSISAQLLGWMGPDGFVAGTSKPEHRFSGEFKWNSYDRQESPLLSFSQTVYRLNIEDRKITPLFTAPAGQTIQGADASSTGAAELIAFGSAARFCAVTTDKSIFVLSDAGDLLQQWPTDSMIAPGDLVRVTRAFSASARPLVIHISRYDATHPQNSHERFIKLESNAVALDQTLPPLGAINPTDETNPVAAIAAMSPAAALAMTGIALLNGEIVPHEMLVRVLLASLGGGVVWSLVLLSLGRAFLERRRADYILWFVIAFLFGAIGLILMVSMRARTRRRVCSSCGKLRSITLDRCEHCAASWPAPTPDGTDIFAVA